ncbi:PAS domain S-box protein [Candidatus Borrarchaeum sp.]|uniref:PAS domain-containing sensor histidine kinase n=1 Tax=Candidatus Borrarchaeum sp. TaxID=2846742 RepID=UPI00257E4C2B|nr:PAS domain S-box protein [Candidatus Borrarchaeum sp.]
MDKYRDLSTLKDLDDYFFKKLQFDSMQKGVLNALPYMVRIIDKSLNIVWANKISIERCGNTIGKKWNAVYENCDEDYPDCVIRQIFAKGEKFETENSIIFTNHTRRDFLISHSPLKDLNGKVIAVIESLKDITKRKQVEKEIMESQRKYSTIVERGNDGIVLIQDGLLKFANLKFIEITGFSLHSLFGKPFMDFFSTEYKELFVEINLENSDQNENENIFEAEIIPEDGSKIPVEINSKKFKYEGRTAYVSIIRDITKRKLAEEKLKDYTENLENKIKERTKALRESEKKYSTIVERGNDGIVIIQDDVLKFANSKIVEFTGFSLKEAIGQPFINFISPEYRELILDRYKKKLSGENVQNKYEVKILSKDGREIPVEINASIIEYKGYPADMALIRDITERKLTDEKLNQTLVNLERSNTELEQFAYIACHDLQEPLRMVASFLQLLERRYWDKIDEAATEFISYAVDGATRMQQMINDLLAFSRVGTRGKPFENVNSKNVLDLAIANLALLIEENDAIITQSSLPIVYADPLQLTQVFQNLIVNGIKFRRADPPRIHVSSERKGEWVFSVKDNGIGIDSKHFNRIFSIFQRLNTKGKYPGSGIGLSICKKIVERHGGRIRVESKLGRGSTFFFTIPMIEGEIL